MDLLGTSHCSNLPACVKLEAPRHWWDRIGTRELKRHAAKGLMSKSDGTSIAPGQESEWELISALSPDDPGRAQRAVVDEWFLDGALDGEALTRAFRLLTGRHDALRLRFLSIDFAPRVTVLESDDPPVEFIDASRWQAARRSQYIEEFYRQHETRCFDLIRGPLWRAYVIRLYERRHLLVFCIAEIVADGWSAKVFIDDLLKFYGAEVGLEQQPADSPLSFEQVSRIQERRLTPTPDKLDYWRQRLVPVGSPPPFASEQTEFAADNTREIAFAIEPEVGKAVRRGAWRLRTTPFVALMGCYVVALAVTRNEPHAVLHTTTYGRKTIADRHAIGMFTTDSYVSTTCEGDSTLSDCVQSVHVEAGRALAHSLSYTTLARAVNENFNAQRPWPDHNLFDSTIYSVAFGDADWTCAGLQVRRVRLSARKRAEEGTPPRVSALAEPTYRAWLAGGAPAAVINIDRNLGALIFNAAAYETTAIETLAKNFNTVVRAFAQSPDTRVGTLSQR